MKTSKTHTAIHPRDISRHEGFTLVELLVVITIIIVLAAAVFAISGKIRSKAQQANTLSSLRQVAAYGTAYSTESNGNINTYRWPEDRHEGPHWVKNTFWGRLQPYIFPDISTSDGALQKDIKKRVEALINADTSNRTYKGTAFDGPRTFADESGIPLPFSFNINLYDYDDWVKTSSIRDPSQVLYVVIGHAHFNETHAKSYVPMATGGVRNPNPIYFMPDKKILASFVDGHVESIFAPVPDRMFK